MYYSEILSRTRLWVWYFGSLYSYSNNGPRIYKDTLAFFVIQERSHMFTIARRHILT